MVGCMHRSASKSWSNVFPQMPDRYYMNWINRHCTIFMHLHIQLVEVVFPLNSDTILPVFLLIISDIPEFGGQGAPVLGRLGLQRWDLVRSPGQPSHGEDHRLRSTIRASNRRHSTQHDVQLDHSTLPSGLHSRRQHRSSDGNIRSIPAIPRRIYRLPRSGGIRLPRGWQLCSCLLHGRRMENFPTRVDIDITPAQKRKPAKVQFYNTNVNHEGAVWEHPNSDLYRLLRRPTG